MEAFQGWARIIQSISTQKLNYFNLVAPFGDFIGQTGRPARRLTVWAMTLGA
jgi:hypothetical protein